MVHRLLVDNRHVAAVVRRKVSLVRREEGAQLGVFGWRLERIGLQVVGLHARHPQLAHCRPHRLRHRRLVRQWAEVATLQRQVQQQPHHQRGAESFFRRIDAALHEERRTHAKRDVEWRHEAQVEPVRPAERDALADGSPDSVSRDKDPLRARDMCATEVRELLNEWIHSG